MQARSLTRQARRRQRQRLSVCVCDGRIGYAGAGYGKYPVQCTYRNVRPGVFPAKVHASEKKIFFPVRRNAMGET